MPSSAVASTDYLSLTAREYGFKFGIWRMMEILDKHGVKATVFMSGMSAEEWPDSAQALARAGHEIASHCYDQSIHPPQHKSRDEERQNITKSIDAIERATGQRPVGYLSPGPRPTDHTLELIAELGFIWDGDYYDSDIPYIIPVNGQRIVSLCYKRAGYTDNDVLGYSSGSSYISPTAAFQTLQDEFDAVFEESARHPMRLAYSCHSYNTGRPGAASVLDRFLEYCRAHEGVWFARGVDKARFWLEHSA